MSANNARPFTAFSAAVACSVILDHEIIVLLLYLIITVQSCYACHSVNVSFSVSVSQSASISLSLCQFPCLCRPRFLYLSLCLSICTFFCLSLPLPPPPPPPFSLSDGTFRKVEIIEVHLIVAEGKLKNQSNQ